MIHLHGHSTFSFLDGYGTPKQIATRIKELGHTACAMTDHGNVFAHVPWQVACKEVGIRPIFGCEFYVVDDLAARTRHQDTLGANAYPHVTILARTQRGYEHLLKLQRISWQDGFYYKPRVDWETIARYQEGLIVLSGCVGGYPSRLIVDRNAEAAWRFLAQQRANIEHLFVELIPQPGLERSHQVTSQLIKIAQDLRLPYVMTADAHFPRAEDHDVQDLMLAVGLRKRKNDPTRELRLPEYQYYCTQQELLDRARRVDPGIPDSVWCYALAQSTAIAEACQVEIPKGRSMVFPGCGTRTAAKTLWDWVQRGAVTRGVSLDARYHERAVREFTTIERKGFCDYLLAIIDLVRHMKEQDALVMLRGSAGGSLLLWLTGASETDPIEHGLSFERFYDDNRMDPPDVDIDFEQARRDEAIRYVYQLYGEANCSQIAALSQLKAKAAVQDAAFALGIPRSAYVALSEALESQDDDVEHQITSVTDSAARAVIQRYPDLGRYAQQMVGQYRQSSIHAAGILISPDPLDKIIGVVISQAKQPVAAVDKKGAASLGLLKMDFLSVSAYDVIGRTVRKLCKPMSWLYTLPLNDHATLKTGQIGYLAGVFQLDGGSAARVSAQIGLHTFEDVVAASALCRPGPGDWVETYRRHKRDPDAFSAYLALWHPIARRIIADTYGILVYQEQVMALARELAGFEWPDVHKLRKGIADKLGLDPNTGAAWRAEWSTKFIAGCQARGVTPEEAIHWWQSCETHGGYSFNKAHCVTYGVVGYWMLYLKTHHPAEFYESYLQLEDDAWRVKRLIFEFRSFGGEVRLLDPVLSQASFSSPESGVLIGGYLNIHGIGPKTAEKLMAHAPYRTWDDMYTTAGPGLAKRLRQLQCTETIVDGISDAAEWNVQDIIQAASWFPVPQTGKAERALKERWGLMSLDKLTVGEQFDGDAVVAGYVVATHFDKDRVRVLLEDEYAVVSARVPARSVSQIGPAVRKLRVSDYVAVKGWWSGDALYVRECVLLQRHESVSADEARKATKAAAA